jgi:putative transposase
MSITVANPVSAMGGGLHQSFTPEDADYDREIEAPQVMADHVHLFVSYPPRYAPTQMINSIKRLTARRLHDGFPHLHKVQCGGRIWTDGYYVGSSGEHVISDPIRRSIEPNATSRFISNGAAD